MKHLKNCVKLNSIVKIYVPSTYDVDKKIDNEEWIDKTLTFLSEKFRGATASPALGAWVSQGGELIKEDVAVVFSYCLQSDLKQEIDNVYDFCVEMRNVLKQESISLEVNGELYFV